MQRLRIAAASRAGAPVLSAAGLALIAVLLLCAAGLIGPPSATASGESSSLAAPTVTAFTPISGPVGTSVTVSGARLTGATRVTFNGTRAATFSVLSATRLRATVPSGATTGRIAVTTSGGTASSATRFTITKAVTAPRVSAFTPVSGPVGTSVTVTGSSFTGATRIAFNDTAAATFSVLGATRLRATVPSGATTGRIAVTTAGGTATSAASFTVTDPTAAVELWVDPAHGSDAGAGTSRVTALRTLSAAWARVPAGEPLGVKHRIRLLPGRYSEDAVPGWMDDRHGTADAPLAIEAADGAGTVILPNLNIHDCSHLQLLDLAFESGGTPATSGGNTLHFEACDHVLLKGCRVTGLGEREDYTTPQETVKVNQCSYVTIQECDISGAWNPAVDFVAVQHGAILRNRIHRAGDWGIYLKGGSAYLTIEGNEIYDCGTGGFSAGQGTGFEFMVSPWLHYEATDIKFVNNVIHDTEGAGMGVNGAYNVLLAWNTLYRVGRRSHAIEIVQGARSCDGDVAICRGYLAAGGWGTATPGDGGVQPIPNRNVFIFNNLVCNPDGYQSAWSHFALYAPRATSAGSNIPDPARADDNVVIRGNVLWNGAPDLSLGIGEEGAGGQPGNPACNAAQVLAQNAVNTVHPTLVDPEHGDYRLASGWDLAGAQTVAIPAFPGGDRPVRPLAPEGELANTVATDITGSARAAGDPPGAWRLRAAAAPGRLPAALSRIFAAHLP